MNCAKLDKSVRIRTQLLALKGISEGNTGSSLSGIFIEYLQEEKRGWKRSREN